MTNSRRFTIESDAMTEDAAAPEETAPPEGTGAGGSTAVTIEEIKAAVAAIVRDELQSWAPGQAPQAPPGDEADAGAAVPDTGENDVGAKEDILRELAEIQAHIATTKAEIAALKPEEGETSQFYSAKLELQEIVDATAKATNDILSESEKVIEVSNALRDKLPDDQVEALGEEIATLDNSSTQIMLACGFQDLTGQRITKVVNTMIFVEERINKLTELWKIENGTGASELVSVRDDDDRPDKDLLNGPQGEGEGISQNDIDAMFA